MATIKLSFRQLATIAERSSGYSVDVVESGRVFALANIRFDRRPSGRINRAVVVCESNGRPARFNSDDVADVVD